MATMNEHPISYIVDETEDCMKYHVYRDDSVPFDSPVHQVIQPVVEKMQKYLNKRVVIDVGFEKENVVRVYNFDGFIASVHLSYSTHNSLVLTPDMFWIRIIQGLSDYIRLNQRKVRNKIKKVKQKLSVPYENDSFVTGEHNDWSQVFTHINSSIKSNTESRLYNKCMETFTTTNIFHKTVINSALSQPCKTCTPPLFCTKCGIPAFRFSASKQDWLNLVKKTEILKYYGMDFWYDSLKPILDQIINMTNDNFDLNFWRNIYKVQGGSGGPYISGWILRLYPYLRNDVLNEYLNVSIELNQSEFKGITTNKLPTGLYEVPFRWKYSNSIYNMKIILGAIGVAQDSETNALLPAYGWVLIDQDKTDELELNMKKGIERRKKLLEKKRVAGKAIKKSDKEVKRLLRRGTILLSDIPRELREKYQETKENVTK
jgi:hypothetical protein